MLALSDEQLLRYSRQIMLPQLDVTAQARLLESRALIIGLGGLGSPVALYLAAAGVGHLVLADGDQVDCSNLQRQIIHSTAHLGVAKVKSAAERLSALNPEVQLSLVETMLTEDSLHEQVTQVDVVVDCTDQWQTRLMINRACVALQKPLVSAAAIRWEGQISVFDSRQPNSPCYACFYGNVSSIPQTCSENGVIGPLLGVMGSMQALETLKLLTGVGSNLIGRVMLFDALHLEWTSVQLAKRADCSVCSGRI